MDTGEFIPRKTLNGWINGDASMILTHGLALYRHAEQIMIAIDILGLGMVS